MHLIKESESSPRYLWIFLQKRSLEPKLLDADIYQDRKRSITTNYNEGIVSTNMSCHRQGLVFANLLLRFVLHVTMCAISFWEEPKFELLWSLVFVLGPTCFYHRLPKHNWRTIYPDVHSPSILLRGEGTSKLFLPPLAWPKVESDLLRCSSSIHLRGEAHVSLLSSYLTDARNKNMQKIEV